MVTVEMGCGGLASPAISQKAVVALEKAMVMVGTMAGWLAHL